MIQWYLILDIYNIILFCFLHCFFISIVNYGFSDFIFVLTILSDLFSVSNNQKYNPYVNPSELYNTN